MIIMCKTLGIVFVFLPFICIFSYLGYVVGEQFLIAMGVLIFIFSSIFLGIHFLEKDK
jgi:hypothetical protein